MAKKTQSKQDIDSVIINQLTIMQTNRRQEDIASWQSALKSAENILNPRRKKLYELYHNVLTDGFLRAVVDKRIRAVQTAPVIVEGEQDDKDLEMRFKTPWFFHLLRLIMEARFWGHSLIELIPFEDTIDDVLLIPRQHVVPEKGLIQLREGSDQGAIPYRDAPWSNYLLEVGSPKDLGILNNCAPYVLYKRGNLVDYSDFNEMFGQPIRQYEYDPHNPAARIEAEKAAKEAGSASYIVVPKGTALTLHQASGISASGTFKDLNKVLNEELAITVLGQTLTTTTEGIGSNALGRVHKDVEESINLEDKMFTEYVLNWQLKDMLIAHGWPLEGRYIRFDDTQRMDTKERADMYLSINKSLPMDPDFIYEDLNIPKPSPEAVAEWKEQMKLKITQPRQQGGGAAGKP